MNSPRDPSASRAKHAWRVIDRDSYASSYLEWAQASGKRDDFERVPPELASALLCRYCRGDSVEELKQYFHASYLPLLEAAQVSYQLHHGAAPLVLKREGCDSWMLLFGLICFDEDGSKITHLDGWFSRSGETVLYSMVLKGFVPGYRYSERYDARRESIPYESAVVSALLQPRETWAAALGAFLRKWPKLMEARGYRDEADDKMEPFSEFPFHVGVAVCAFDIDDATFRDLPWYPRELVDYYRAHIRHTRDAWRSNPIDPAQDLPESARPKVKKPSSLSKAQAYTRWIELVTSNAEQLERAWKALGRRKTMSKISTVMEALAGVGLAIQADIKDDATVEEQLLALCATRQLPPPLLPEQPPQGPARISALLAVLQAHTARHAQRMAVLDDGSDTWNVVLHADASSDEFSDLCEQLQLDILSDDDWL